MRSSKETLGFLRSNRGVKTPRLKSWDLVCDLTFIGLYKV